MRAARLTLAVVYTSLGTALCTSTAAAQRARTTVDVLITGGTVITMDSARRVIDDGAVAVKADRIVAVGTSADLLARFTGRPLIDARVCGLVGGGAHAEYLVTHERAVAEVPAGVDWLVAGASPESCITAQDALVAQAGVRPGERRC